MPDGEELTLDKVFSAIRMTLRGEVATLQAVKDEPVEQGEVITVQVRQTPLHAVRVQRALL
jgi:hypothetical protein